MNRISLWIVRSPLLWGALLTLAFYVPIHIGILTGEFVRRYFTDSWVEYVETALFWVALAALLIKCWDTLDQSAALNRSFLGPIPPTPLAAVYTSTLIDELDSLSERRRQGYLYRRIRTALEKIQRQGSADSLEEDLLLLNEEDKNQAHDSLGLVRIIIWAIPILGFLGTVIGITMAISGLSPDALENSLPVVTKGLGIAFDTTALALGLSMVLMFVQFGVQNMENRLLQEVDNRAQAELFGRFEQLGTSQDPQQTAVRRMAETVIKSCERLVQRQAEVWQGTIDAAHQRWNQVMSVGQQQMESALAGAWNKTLGQHTERLVAVEQSLAEQNRQHWEKIRLALTDNGNLAKSQQLEMIKQGEVLLKVVQATGQVKQLQDSLNSNLASLAAAQHLEETLLNLSAAIHLLNARLGQIPGTTTHPTSSTGHKAA